MHIYSIKNTVLILEASVSYEAAFYELAVTVLGTTQASVF